MLMSASRSGEEFILKAASAFFAAELDRLNRF
jgi:hypothetical protein